MRRFFLILSLFLIGCNSSLERKDSTQYDKGSFNQLTKTDFDRMADYEIKENTESLKILALKFYKKNPAELRKTTSDSPEVTVNWLFTNQHNWKFKENWRPIQRSVQWHAFNCNHPYPSKVCAAIARRQIARAVSPSEHQFASGLARSSGKDVA